MQHKLVKTLVHIQRQVKSLLVLSMLITTIGYGATTIEVDWALDEEPSSNIHTCNYSQGGLFQPDTTGSGAGKCTFRRALRQAGAMADENACPGCTPITIIFDGLKGANGDADDIQFNTTNGQWILPVSSAASSSFFGLKPQSSATDVTGPITIIGPDINVLNGQMPIIMIDTQETLDVEIDGVTIQSIGFMGGMSIHWKQAHGVFQNNTWGLSADGMTVVFGDLLGNTDNLAGSHGILTTNKADDMLINGNIITGASTFAIEINSATQNVEISNNRIGTRVDGTVPVVPGALKCRTFTNINPVFPAIDANEWFGGAGISAAGLGLLIQGNHIAGLQTIHSTFSTPPEALTIFGKLHTVELNIIGKDSSGEQVGVCGQGLKLSTQREGIVELNNGHMILDNQLYGVRNGFANTTGAILWSDTTVNSFLDGGNTIRRNLVIDGPEKYFEIGPLLTTPIRTFEPAQITAISGINVTGENHLSNFNGDPSPCPNCTIDFYLDDTDANQEALAYLGSTTANANGQFNFTLTAPLANGFGIRTTSTSVANETIPNTWSGQTSKMSSELYTEALPETIFNNGFE